MIDPGWTPSASRRFDPKEVVLCTDPRHSRQRPHKDTCSEKLKAGENIHDMDAFEIMMERVARRVYRECRKEDLMLEAAYLLDMKG